MILKEDNNVDLNINKHLIILKRKRLLDCLNTPDDIVFSLLNNLLNSDSFKRHIDKKVEYWFKHDTECSLMEFLKMSKKEYTEWVKGELNMTQNNKNEKSQTLDETVEELKKYTIKKLEETTGVSFHRMIELAIADRDGKCVILDTKSKESEVICEFVKILDWITKSVEKHDFSPFRIIAGAPENTYPVVREFNKILDKYDETIYTAFKNIEVLSSTESEK